MTLAPSRPEREPSRRAEDGPLCNAPLTSLHLDPSGNVRVCELNSLAMLGRVPDDRLIDLWRGERIGRIRAALAEGDTSLGCEACAGALAVGHRDHAHTAYYDQFAPTAALPEWPVQLELSLSNACNLECTMCNGDLSSAIRARRERLPPLPKVYGDEFFDDLSQFLPHLERVTFIGGEPFLGPESLRVFDMLIAEARHVPCGVTTNGTVLTPRVERILRALPVEVSISVDGATPETYASIRRGGDLATVRSNIARFRELAAHVSLNMCLMVQNWWELGAMLESADADGLDVHVNTVTAPPRFSLYHLSRHELLPIVEALGREGRRRRFGRNQAVWDRHVGRLRDHLDRRDGSTVAPSSAPVLLRRSAAVLAREVADERGVHVIDIGPSEQILDIRPDPRDMLGLDLSALVGGHLTALVGAFTDGFGELVATDLSYRPGGVEDRRMTFSRDGVDTEMRAVLAPVDPNGDGVTSRWHFAARSTRRAT